MSKTIQIIGEFQIEDHEFDPSEDGPLTDKAFGTYNRKFKMLKNRCFTLVDDSGNETGPTNSKAKPKAKPAAPPAASEPVLSDVEQAEKRAREAAEAAYAQEIADLGSPLTDVEPGAPLDPALVEDPVEAVREAPAPVAAPPVAAPPPIPAPVAAPPVVDGLGDLDAPTTAVVPPPMPVPDFTAPPVPMAPPSEVAPPVAMALPTDFGEQTSPPHPDDEEVPF